MRDPYVNVRMCIYEEKNILATWQPKNCWRRNHVFEKINQWKILLKRCHFWNFLRKWEARILGVLKINNDHR